MTAHDPAELWPWLTVVLLGGFHGLNPAMGWLFAVALGLQRGDRAIVGWSLLPIALGHAAAVALVVVGVLLLGAVIDLHFLRFVCAGLLFGWAAKLTVYGHKGKVRFGMTAGLAGLAAWSFLVASAHGAGLMLVPVLIPPAFSEAPIHDLPDQRSFVLSLALVGLHTLAMLAVTATIAYAVYEISGIGFLRRGWINFDWIWICSLLAAGLLVLPS